MLKVNLIRQRLESASEKRIWWTAAGIISGLCLVVAAVIIVSRTTSLKALDGQLKAAEESISSLQGEANEVSLIRDDAMRLEPISSLAEEVRDSAGQWGELLHDLNQAVPARSGVWLTTISTDFDAKTYSHSLVIDGSGNAQDEVSAFERSLTTLEYSFDPNGVTMPQAQTHIDESSGTQIIDFQIQATMREPIGVNFQ